MEAIITKQLLASVGITIPADQEQTFIEHLNRTLQERIGTEITDSLEDAQLEELVELQQSDDEAAVQTWLKTNVPELDDIIKDEIDVLLGEIAENTDGINATT